MIVGAESSDTKTKLSVVTDHVGPQAPLHTSTDSVALPEMVKSLDASSGSVSSAVTYTVAPWVTVTQYCQEKGELSSLFLSLRDREVPL